MPKTIFTIYDALENNGYFDANPANTFARDKTTGASIYKFQEFPKMLYHPEGEEEIVVPAELLSTPLGPKAVGEQRQLINRIVENEAEAEAAFAEGWHDHPSKAIRVRIEGLIASSNFTEKEIGVLLKKIPIMTSATRIKDLEAEIARLTADRDREATQRAKDTAAQAPAPSTKPVGGSRMAPTVQPSITSTAQPSNSSAPT